VLEITQREQTTDKAQLSYHAAPADIYIVEKKKKIHLSAMYELQPFSFNILKSPL